MTAPLSGLRVLELATGIAGPYAGRLLAMLGATVVKAEPPGGDPVRGQPVDSQERPGPGALHVHLNAGKRLVRRAAFELADALAWADAVIESRVAAELDGSPVAPERLTGDRSPALVTTSPWGFRSGRPGQVADELLVQAKSGAMSVTGDPGGPPLRFPGFQSQYFAGANVAAAALLAVREPGIHHVDVPWIHAMASGVEMGWSINLQTGRRQPPGGPHQLDVFPSGALPCKDGYVVPGTVRPADWVAQCKVYGREDLVRDERFRSRRRRRRNRVELWSILEPWYAARTRSEMFTAALDAVWAMGMVLRGSDVAADPHMTARGYLGEVSLPDGGRVAAPARPWRAPGLPVPNMKLGREGEDDVWFSAELASVPRPVASKRSRALLADIRILELTQAWAGPFVGRFLGAFGADVVKVESARRPDGWRGPQAFGDLAPHVGRPKDELSVEIAANFNTINRNKRHCSIDLTNDAGRATFLDLVSRADVVVANMTARVLPQLRLAYEDLRRVNEAIILIHMPALGSTGPYCQAAGYGTIVEGMGGFGALFGAPDEGARISQTYYPDPVAGLHASLAVLSMLERRDRLRTGGEVDLSHQEILWLQLGETIVAAGSGADVERLGNAIPGAATSGVFPARDERWIAVVSDVPCEDCLAASVERTVEELIASLEERGARATEVLHVAEARSDEAMVAAIERVDHPVTQGLPYLRVPLRVDDEPVDTRSAAPLFDANTREVLAEWLGLAEGEIDALEAGGGVGGAPDPKALRAFYQNISRGAKR